MVDGGSICAQIGHLRIKQLLFRDSSPRQARDGLAAGLVVQWQLGGDLRCRAALAERFEAPAAAIVGERYQRVKMILRQAGGDEAVRLVQHVLFVLFEVFYEWSKDKWKYFFRLPEHQVFYMSGIYQKRDGKNCYCILTAEANDSMWDVHPRMSIVLTSELIFTV